MRALVLRTAREDRAPYAAPSENGDTMSRRNALRFAILVFATSCLGGGPTPELCQSISTEYESALMKAKECALGGAQQCTKLVTASFYCRCQVFVEGDTNNLNAIATRFESSGCDTGCQGTCVGERAASCQPDATSSTGGRCLGTNGAP